MTQYIYKSAIVAEIEKLQDSTMDEDGNFYSVETQAEYGVLCVLEEYLDTLEVKEEPISKEYWLFTINFDNAIINCFFDFFPSKKDLKKVSNGKEYAIIHTMQLTEEQFKKLTKDE